MSPTQRSDAETEPDRLLRQHAGSYLTSDRRFELRHGDAGWFVVDTSQQDELGQPLLLGPFGTLNAAREALPQARKISVLQRPIRDRAGDVDSRAAQRRISPHAGGSRVSPTSKSSKSSGAKKAAPKKKTAKSTTKKK